MASRLDQEARVRRQSKKPKGPDPSEKPMEQLLNMVS